MSDERQLTFGDMSYKDMFIGHVDEDQVWECPFCHWLMTQRTIVYIRYPDVTCPGECGGRVYSYVKSDRQIQQPVSLPIDSDGE